MGCYITVQNQVFEDDLIERENKIYSEGEKVQKLVGTLEYHFNY